MAIDAGRRIPFALGQRLAVHAGRHVLRLLRVALATGLRPDSSDGCVERGGLRGNTSCVPWQSLQLGRRVIARAQRRSRARSPRNSPIASHDTTRMPPAPPPCRRPDALPLDPCGTRHTASCRGPSPQLRLIDKHRDLSCRPAGPWSDPCRCGTPGTCRPGCPPPPPHLAAGNNATTPAAQQQYAACVS